MSYILEALRKSEQERNPEKVPNLATHHPQVAKETKTKFSYWILGLAFLLINGLFLIYMMNRNPPIEKPVPAILPGAGLKSEINAEPVVQQTDQLTSAETIIETKPEDLPILVPGKAEIHEQTVIPVADVNNRPDNTSTQVNNNNQPEQQYSTTNRTVNTLDRAALTDIADLPYNFQQQIPAMDFSTHIYVSDGGSFVIINGRSLSEGMIVERGLKVQQILSDGVALEFKGRHFFLSSMTSWQPE